MNAHNEINELTQSITQAIAHPWLVAESPLDAALYREHLALLVESVANAIGVHWHTDETEDARWGNGGTFVATTAVIELTDRAQIVFSVTMTGTHGVIFGAHATNLQTDQTCYTDDIADLRSYLRRLARLAGGDERAAHCS